MDLPIAEVIAINMTFPLDNPEAEGLPGASEDGEAFCLLTRTSAREKRVSMIEGESIVFDKL